MRFPQTFIDDLRRQADIVRVIQDYVALKKTGANWMACCPFHKEKTPSFSVSPTKDIFYCFGCQKGGTVFNFVMEIERVSFPEAIRIVAEKAHVLLPTMVDDGKFESKRKESDEVIEMNTWALEFWEAQLADGGHEARAARDYLTRRQITDETQRVFRLGFAPDSWDALSLNLKRRGATDAQIERSGLVVKKDGSGFYDRFRGRLIFPVFDAQGRALAFGGRMLAAGEPKYLNSPETAAYVKGRHLYGLNLSRDDIRQKKFAILVEGYMDLIALYQAGVRNIVASLGTALTTEQARMIGRFARQVVINYDGDSAGVKAAKRAIETLLAEDLEIKVLVLPDGLDPDDFVRQNGYEAYNERRGKALPHTQFILDQAIQGRNLFNPPEQDEAIKEVLPSVRAVRSLIQRREYFQMAMDGLRVDPEMRKDIWQRVKSGENIADDTLKKLGSRIRSAEPTVAEKQLLELLIHDPELRRIILPRLEPADFEVLPTAMIFQALIESESNEIEFDASTLLTRAESDPVAAGLVPMLIMSEPHRDNGEAVDNVLANAESCLNALRRMAADRRINELGMAIAAAERAGETEERDRLSLEHLEWTRKRNSLASFHFN
jgi:DNA primase